MKLLLDTRAFIWATSRSRLLSARVADLIKDPENCVLISAASAYQIEFNRARDPVLAALPADLDEAVDQQGFDWLAVSPAHAIMAGRLPRLSGDPFDRILVAQALIENATILTRDPLVMAYGPVSAW